MKKSIYIITIASLAGVLALAGSTFAESEHNPSPSPSVSPSVSPTPKPEKTDKDKKNSTVNLACVASAVNKRETAIAALWSSYSASTTQALATRKSDLSAAWTITVKKDREKAIKTAWNKFQQSVKGARETAKNARKAAWKTFKSDVQACGKDASKAVEDTDKEDGGDDNLF